MFRHVVAEVFEQRHLLVECLRKQFECVKELGSVALNVLDVPAQHDVQPTNWLWQNTHTHITPV